VRLLEEACHGRRQADAKTAPDINGRRRIEAYTSADAGRRCRVCAHIPLGDKNQRFVVRQVRLSDVAMRSAHARLDDERGNDHFQNVHASITARDSGALAIYLETEHLWRRTSQYRTAIAVRAIESLRVRALPNPIAAFRARPHSVNRAR
jgi:hypothetical protein